MKIDALEAQVNAFWDGHILPALQEYVRIPNESPAFDKEWAVHGHMDRAVQLVSDWILAQRLSGAELHVLREGTRTPLILVDVPGSLPQTVLMYGHLDKQPPFTGWREGLGPWQPVLDAHGRLYGRGAADDGYAAF
ncbi:MAG TPA: peptidase M20, partial [bacterium]|nr:peptidase M20 [bacterium]